jgi:hypothetical protein
LLVLPATTRVTEIAPPGERRLSLIPRTRIRLTSGSIAHVSRAVDTHPIILLRAATSEIRYRVCDCWAYHIWTTDCWDGYREKNIPSRSVSKVLRNPVLL